MTRRCTDQVMNLSLTKYNNRPRNPLCTESLHEQAFLDYVWLNQNSREAWPIGYWDGTWGLSSNGAACNVADRSCEARLDVQLKSFASLLPKLSHHLEDQLAMHIIWSHSSASCLIAFEELIPYLDPTTDSDISSRASRIRGAGSMTVEAMISL